MHCAHTVAKIVRKGNTGFLFESLTALIILSNEFPLQDGDWIEFQTLRLGYCPM